MSKEKELARRLLGFALTLRKDAERTERECLAQFSMVSAIQAEARDEFYKRLYDNVRASRDLQGFDLGAGRRRIQQRQQEIDHLRGVVKAVNTGALHAKLLRHLDLSHLYNRSAK